MVKKDITKMLFSDIYPLYIQKAERKGHNKDEVDQIICWLTGYNKVELDQKIKEQVDLATFFGSQPLMPI